MTPVDLPPLEPSSVRPGGQWQPPPSEARVAAPPTTSDAWSITGAGWPTRPEDVFALLFSWPETRTIQTPQPILDLRQVFANSAFDLSDADAIMTKLQSLLRGNTPDSAATDWTTNLIQVLRTQLAQQPVVQSGRPADGLTQLLRHALNVLNRDGNPPSPTPQLPPPSATAFTRVAQSAGEQSYLFTERETVSGLLTQQPEAQPMPAAISKSASPETSPAPTTAQSTGSTANTVPGSSTTANTPTTATPANPASPAPADTPANAPSGTTPQQPSGPNTPSPAQMQTPAQPLPSQPGQPLAGQPATNSLPTPTTTTPTPAAVGPSTAQTPSATGTPTLTAQTTEAHPLLTRADGTPLVTAPQGSIEIPIPSLAEIIARASSFDSQTQQTPALRWPWAVSTSVESPASTPTSQANAPATPSPSASTPPAATHPAAIRSSPDTAPHQEALAQQKSVGAQATTIAKVDARTESPNAVAPPSARVEQAAQNAIAPQQRVGMLPLMMGQEPVPAWVQMEWLPVNDRDGRGGEARDQQALMVSVHIAGETLGRVAFHLAWMPKELAGTIVVEKPEVLHAAQDELPDLETRLAEAGLPPPRLRLLKHASVPWKEETQEMEPS